MYQQEGRRSLHWSEVPGAGAAAPNCFSARRRSITTHLGSVLHFLASPVYLSDCSPLPPTQPLKTTSPAKLHYDFERSEFRRFVSGLQRTLLLVQKPKSLSDLNIIYIENILPYCPKTSHISVKIHKPYHCHSSGSRPTTKIIQNKNLMVKRPIKACTHIVVFFLKGRANIEKYVSFKADRWQILFRSLEKKIFYKETSV